MILMDKQTLDAGIATFVIVLVIMFFSIILFKNDIESNNIVFKEAELVKNKPLQIQAGEKYVYNLSNNTYTYLIFQGYDCTAIRLVEYSSNSTICVDQWGLDESGSNFGYNSPSVLIFKPWMLAVYDNWNWSAEIAILVSDSPKSASKVQFIVNKTEEFKGRKAYVVEEWNGGEFLQREWIDSEKRILLKLESQNGNAELIEGLEFK